LSKREKRLQKIRQNPHDVSMIELEQILNDFGIRRDRVTGSHYIFRYTLQGESLGLTIPYRKPVKPIYVKRCINVIDQLIEQEAEDDDDENN
jgi:hypothetical protein